MDFMNDIPAGTTTSRILKDPERYEYPPSHICAVCEKMEYPEASIGTTKFWICPECLEVLRAMVMDSKNRMNINKNIMKYKHD